MTIPTLSEAALLEALRDCYDPTLSCNIVDLGLLRSTTVSPDVAAPGQNIPGVPQRHLINITLTLTNPCEDTEAQVRAQIQNRLAGLETISRTTILFDHTAPWNPQQITPAGRTLLGLGGNPTLIQITPR